MWACLLCQEKGDACQEKGDACYGGVSPFYYTCTKKTADRIFSTR
jgi:hypothetical protein